MNVVLIPFLLAANVTANDTEPWPHGAEVSYRGTVNVTMKNTEFGVLTVDMSARLKCRERDNASLICSMSDVKVASSMQELAKHISAKTREITKPFLIEFDERGVSGLTIPSTATGMRAVIYKSVADMLHVGVDLNEFPYPLPLEFMEYENSTFGLCETKFKLHDHSRRSQVASDSPDEPDVGENGFGLTVLSLPRHRSDKVLRIDKSKLARDCDRSAEFVEQNKGSVKIRPYLSKMYIDDSGAFVSNRTNAYSYLTNDGDRPSVLTGQFLSKLQLEGIERAEGELPSVADGVSTDLAYENLDIFI